MNELYLTSSERELWEKLPESVREGWTVKEEHLVYEDSDRKRRIRFAQAHIQHPALRALRACLLPTQTVFDRQNMLAAFDWASVPHTDVQEILYAFGPSLLGEIMQHGLSTVESDEDLEQIAAYAIARHLFFA